MKARVFVSAAVLAGCGMWGCQGMSELGGARRDGWRDTFNVDKSRLGPNGGNAFFALQPGDVKTYRDGHTTLTISVLDQTRVVDGVTTRIVEEREEVGGKPKEISRNFFAADAATGDVYYFGEEVDDYDTAGHVSHPGAWISGVKGARFGLMMPARPRVGDRFYQELAPGVALDRFEVVSTSARVETPAGRFDNVLYVRETTPLENDVGYKWYAPGVGLVKDGGAALVKYNR